MLNREQAIANVRKVRALQEEKCERAAQYHIDTVIEMAVKVESEKGETFAKRQLSTCDEAVLNKVVEILKRDYDLDAHCEGNWITVDWTFED